MIDTLTFTAKDDDQSLKADAGKWQMTLVPPQIIIDIAEVRAYGVKKYGSEDSWRLVKKIRYVNALFRHLIAYLLNPYSCDSESGISHFKHAECNMAFIAQMQADEEKELKQLEREICHEQKRD